MSVAVPTVERALPPIRFWLMITGMLRFFNTVHIGHTKMLQPVPDKTVLCFIDLALCFGSDRLEYQ